MASVTIDIPGVGNVEAKNAASEATLRELVNAIKGMKGAGGKGGGASDKEDEKQAKDKKKRGKEEDTAFTKLAKTVSTVSSGFSKLTTSVINTADTFAQLDGSVTGAAAVFNKLPIIGGIVGGAFSAVAGAADRLTKSYVTAASGGASFGGSMSSFAAAASSAGMNMAQFGALIKSNGEGMLGFGATTEEGAKRFADVSKQLRSSSAELYALGMSTEEINNGLAKYGSMMKQQGLQGTQSNAQLAAGAKKYLTELDALAKITGTDRAAKEAEMQNTLKDAQFQGAMAGKSKEVRDSFLGTLGGLAGGMQGPLANFSKDILSTGTATTEENQKLMGMMGGSVALLQQMRAKMNRGEAVTEAERNELNNMMAVEGARASKQMGSAFASAPEFAGTMNALTLAQSMQKDGLKNATAEQKAAAENTDKMNKKMQGFQQSLAEVGNTFTAFLANSSLLDTMMSAFNVLANLVAEYVLPAFESIANFIKNTVYPAFLSLAAFVLVDVVPALQTIGGMINDYVLPAFTAVGGFIFDNLMPILAGLGAGFVAYAAALAYSTAVKAFNTVTTISETGARIGLLAGLSAQIAATWASAAAMLGLSAPMLGVVVAVAAVVAIFAALYKSGWSFSSALEAVGDNITSFGLAYVDIWLSIAEKIAKFFGGGEAITAAREKIKDKQADLEVREKKRDAERASTADERSNKKEKEAKVAELNSKFSHTKKLEDANSKELAAKEAAIPKTDFGSSNSLDILKSEVAIAEGPKASPVAKAETAKKEMEAKSDKDKAEQSAKKEEVKKEEGEKAAPAQETSESLLASLNTKLDQLIKVNMNMKDVQDRQLTVQQGLSGDLFASV